MYFNAFQYSATLTFIPLKSPEDNASEYEQVLKEKGSMAQTGLTKTVKHLASHRFHHTLKKRKDSLEVVWLEYYLQVNLSSRRY